jgi:hypothetical protein
VPESAHAAVSAEEVLVLAGTEQVLGEFMLALNKTKPSGLTTVAQNLVRRHIEQLQRKVLCVRSTSASKRTAPQWQEPE